MIDTASASAVDTSSSPAPRRTFLVVLAGCLLIQLAWVVSLPAFRGIDEFDHVFKAESVAHGAMAGRGPAAHGRGQLVLARRSVVEDSSAVCASYEYTGRDNCHPVGNAGGDLVYVASAAASYNPAYYAVVGTLARPFEGYAADIAMRVVTALIAALLIAWSAVITASWARNVWPLVALVVGATPVLLYSSAIASPNGIGYAAAAVVWATALEFVETGTMRLRAWVVAPSVLVVSHLTGLMWLALILVSVLPLLTRERLRVTITAQRRAWVLAGSTLSVVAAATLTWVVVNKTNALGPVENAFPALTGGRMLRGQVLWALQTVAAFPLRNEQAPEAVYALWLIPFVTLVVLASFHVSRQVVASVVLVFGAWLAVPTMLTIVSYASEGLAWQGRYALPLSLGFTALAGLALSRRGGDPPRPVVLVLSLPCAVAHAVSVASVARSEASRGLAPTVLDPVTGGWILAGTLALAGGLMFTIWLWRGLPERQTAAAEQRVQHARAGART